MAERAYYYLSEKEKELLYILFRYRGMRAKDLVVFYEGTVNYTLSEEKSVYNYLAALKEKGYVKSVRLQGINERGSMYYLTSQGLEAVKSLKNIEVGQSGNGFLPEGRNTRYWDIPYSYQLPPLKQNGHFLQTIEFFKKLIADNDFPLSHRTNFYCILGYEEEGVRKKLLPDAAVTINGDFYSVEIDQGTENREQLINKFERYKAYYEYAKEHDKRQVSAILFIVPEKNKRHGMTRRWTNVLSAFFAAFDEEIPPINLIFLSMDEVPRILALEKKRKSWMEFELDELKDKATVDYELLEYEGFTIAKNNQEYKAFIYYVHHEFESRIFSDLLAFRDTSIKLKKDKQFKDLTFKGWKGQLTYVNRKPMFPVGIERTGLSIKLIDLLEITKPYFEWYKTE